MTLLDKALEVGTKRGAFAPEEELDLAIAWYEGHITNSQVGRALGMENSSVSGVYSFVASRLKQAIRARAITIRKESL